MAPTHRNMIPEDEYFARREGEIERERERRDAAREQLERDQLAAPRQRDATQPPADGSDGPEAAGHRSRIVGAMKALFGIRENRRPRHV
jgi:hypothetical protein